MAITKQDAIMILSSAGREEAFMANAILCQSIYKGKAAKYLKLLACLHKNYVNVKFAPFSIREPMLNYRTVTWEAVELVGNALYKGSITPAQARDVIDKFA